jgi:hypothetical protein
VHHYRRHLAEALGALELVWPELAEVVAEVMELVLVEASPGSCKRLFTQKPVCT